MTCHEQIEKNVFSKQLESIYYDDEILTMTIENRLSIGKIKLYVVETREPDLYPFYYIENVLDAHALHQDLFRETPKPFHFDETSAANILYFYRNKVVAYPY